MKKDYKKGFSLIEMLLTLIIMSLLVSAFVPIVTKKLKSSDITVGSFGTAVTSDDCDQFSSQDHKCIMCTKSSCSLCTSQMNLATGYYVDPAVSCDPKECKDKFTDNCKGCNKDKCTTCSSTVSIGYFRDPDNNCVEEKCSDKFGANCSACNKDTCTSCIAGSGFNNATNTCEKCSAGYSSPGGMSECKKCDAGKISSAGASSCTECSVASHKVANSDGTACVDKYCGQGQYIDGVTCKSCTENTYQTSTSHQNTSCSACASTCGACNKTTGKCTSCALSGYTLSSSGTCTLSCNPQTVTLSGTTTQVTRFNIGDDPNCSREVLASLSGVTFVPVSTSCTDDYCCWYGETATASSCTDQSGGIYSGCNRTVCTWYAADKMCQSIGPGWKLPDTSASMANWYPANSTATTGLMLCDKAKSNSVSSQCNGSYKCIGATDGNRCRPYHHWAYDGGNAPQNRYLNNGGWNSITYSKRYAISARCVKE